MVFDGLYADKRCRLCRCALAAGRVDRNGGEALVEQRGDGGTPRPIATRTRGLRQITAPRLEIAVPSTLPAEARIRDWPMPAHYGVMVRELKSRYKISIRKWRTNISGVAYELTYRDGRIKRLISAPKPRSPVSAAIFLHEVGHHAIGFRRYSLRCLEEYYVWQWTFREMAARDIPIDARVDRHYKRSMYHYVRLARLHCQHVPHDLAHFGHWPG